jgi:hypothetical protein
MNRVGSQAGVDALLLVGVVVLVAGGVLGADDEVGVAV